MANKYGENDARAILLNNGSQQLLPVSKAQLIELANDQKNLFGSYVDVAGALNYLLAQDATNLETAKTYTGEQIGALNATIAPESGYVFGSITETAGKLTSYSQVWLDASVVSYNGDSNVKSAIEALQETLAGLAGEGEGSVQTQITNALDALDLNEVSENGKPITYVSQLNGQVSAGTGNINAQYVNVDNTNLGWDIDGNDGADTDVTVQSAITYLQDEIDGLEESAARYTISEITTSVPETVLHRYQLSQTVNGTTTKAGEYIDIPKDSSLVNVVLGHVDDSLSGEDSTTHESSSSTITFGTGSEALVFVNQLANGNYKLTAVNVESFLQESEFGDGLDVNSSTHEVSVKVDNSSDTNQYLTVGADGIALNGNAIDTAISTAVSTAVDGLDSEIEAKIENNYSYVMTGVTEADGLLTAATYIGLTDENVKTTPFGGEALETLLGSTELANVTDVHDALNAIAGKVNTTGGNAINNIVVTDGTYVKAANATKDGNTYSFTINDSMLGNAATLSYTVLSDTVESVTIFSANPEI